MDRDDADVPPESAGWEDARDEERSLEGGYTTGPDRAVLEAARRQPRRRSRGPRSYQRSDERIREDVCERLFGDTGADATDVVVEVAAAVVTLGGSVPEAEDKRRIETIATRTLGVADVIDRIQVVAPASEGLPVTKTPEPVGG
jgi:osmotically-inducible protein OsmY